MKACSKCKVVKPHDAFAPNKVTKDRRQSWCRECTNLTNSARRKVDLEWQAKRRAHMQSAEYKEYRKAYNATPKGRELQRAARAVAKSNPALKRNYRVFYKLRAEHRCPSWVKPKDIAPFYELAHSLGDGYVVDHIIPLRGKTVSGLHVPQNLQVLTITANELKGVSLHPAWEAAGLRPLTKSESGL